MATRKKHVRREELPWRAVSDRVECGRRLTALTWITRSEFRVVAGEWASLVSSWRTAGASRPPGVRAPDICAVCWETALRWPAWDVSPVLTMRRALDDAGSAWSPGDPGHTQLNAELTALAALYRANPAWFDQLVRQAGETPKAHRG